MLRSDEARHREQDHRERHLHDHQDAAAAHRGGGAAAALPASTCRMSGRDSCRTGAIENTSGQISASTATNAQLVQIDGQLLEHRFRRHDVDGLQPGPRDRQ